MADDIDLMQDREEKLLEARTAYRKPVQAPTGFCFNCDEPLKRGVYCDSDCRDDHELRVRLLSPATAF